MVGERVVAQLRGELYGRLVTLSLDFHGEHRVGELVSRLSSDVTLVRTLLTQTVTTLLSSVIGLVGSVIILFTLSPSLLLVVLLLAPALIVVAIVFGRPLAAGQHPGPGHDRRQHDDGRGGPVRASASSRATCARTGSSSATTSTCRRRDRRSRLALWRAGFGALMGFLGFGAIAALLWYTGHQVIEGSLGIGTLTGFLLYGVAIGASLGTIAGLYGQFREGTGAVARVFEIIDTRPTVVDAPDARPIGPITGRIYARAG